ncbi:xanthine dehydrogenase family Fe-S subunit [Dichotomicrobium thermohalophilum]|uniref:Carbon-monoxide dehydrogenase small subunit n=1 Tax=Dichotomicrobium thermohalophilum TaxID=933063 RepID=A0A397PK50_9HYPH|nr:2Fe-2S iron-sulfur cluster-binding protein [Dichotomicrobium thermohalophilum]RIA47645.1 carbon-monoxide dehydrogenase small subunit [Dichotomicrobium thermohalophilum]
MKTIALNVNGKDMRVDVAPRTHLADCLREQLLLTGTHLGCEHGICGACTVEIDGEIARSCITYAVACDGANIRTIEGFDTDPLMARLRRAFSENHALQCGYCTPGMLIAARDLIRRKKGLSDQEIRKEMSGNLCRCTGYMGITAAIASVMQDAGAGADADATVRRLGPAPGPDAPRFAAGSGERAPAPGPDQTAPPATSATTAAPAHDIEVEVGEIREEGGFTRLSQSFVVAYPREAVWRTMADVEKVATCMPGVTLDGPVRDGKLAGRISVKLGPMTPSFAGEGEVAIDDAHYQGVVEGAGRDSKSASRVRGRVDYRLEETDGGNATRVHVDLAYAVAGPLAQFSRSRLVRDLVSRMAAAFAANLEGRLSGRGEQARGEAQALDAGGMFFSVVWQRIRAFFVRLFGR